MYISCCCAIGTYTYEHDPDGDDDDVVVGNINIGTPTKCAWYCEKGNDIGVVNVGIDVDDGIPVGIDGGADVCIGRIGSV